MPAGVVHRERTAPGEPGEIVLVRLGSGPAVVNVDEPPRWGLSGGLRPTNRASPEDAHGGGVPGASSDPPRSACDIAWSTGRVAGSARDADPA